MNQVWIGMIEPALAPWAAFFAVVCAGFGIYLLYSQRIETINRRLRQIEGPEAITGATRAVGTQQEGEFLVKWLEPAGGLILPHFEWNKSAIKRQLVFAGYRQPRALAIFMGAKLATAVFIAAVFGLLAILSGRVLILSQLQGIALVITGALLGYYLPDLALRNAISRRRQDFVESFPDALDMLVVCVEAGLGLDAAINRVARELRYSHAALASELALISLEVRAGKTRLEAFRSLAERMVIDQVQSLTTIIIQAERFGTSIASSLRNFAEEMRVERIQRAKETAAKLPVKMIFPIVLCIFPALFLVLLGPATVQIINTFSGM
jgi:tight adherence protein C